MMNKNRTIVNQHRMTHYSNDRMRAARQQETQPKQQVINPLKSQKKSAVD